MSPPNERRARPTCNRTGSSKTIAASDSLSVHQFCCQCPAPSTFDLSDAELWAEAAHLFRAGWSADEIRAVLVLPVVIP